MICGAEDLIKVCQEKIAQKPHALSADGKFSWEEVECLGSCSNAPMVQIGKDYYEDLTTESFAAIIDDLAAGNVPVPGPQNGRYAAEPLSGLTSLQEYEAGKPAHNASADLAVSIGDTVKRIDGTEVPLLTPWLNGEAKAKVPAEAPRPKSAVQQAAAKAKSDDLTKLKGVGPKAAEALVEAGVTSFAQIAGWSDEDVAWADENIKPKNKASRDDWRAQAKALVEG